ncbi:MAG: DUF4438 domain-containing protein [Candidatus Krumholzibacteria bacterium]|nr:DUF4438 domain-containing protein [Candidatus Krumholzibacteria bacterium]
MEKKDVGMLRTNAPNCVIKSVLGGISHPRISLKNPYLVDSDGDIHVLPGVGGITYNAAIGDSAFNFAGDHVEPGVSITLDEKDRDGASLGALCVLSCIGNEARVVSGEAIHARGFVTGKHGGVEHVIIDFAPSVLDKLVIGDRVQIRACGQGLELKDFPDVQLMSIDPDLLQRMGIVIQNSQIIVPVTHVIPASIMGSGTGSRHSFSGDYDIQVSDRDLVQKHGLQSLRLGDVIAIRDADCRFGRSIRTDAISIGVIVHASCVVSGHGPGVTVIMTTAKRQIVPKLEQEANIASYLGIGRFHRPSSDGRRRRR